MSARELITDHLDLWTGATISRSTAGRGRNGKIELTGIKKLRELILELAVRGKLVEQDRGDEPASVLLERIAKEKARLIKEGKIKKPKGLLPVEEGSKPFSLPEGWSWIRLGETMEMYNGKAFKSSEWSSTGLPIVRIQNLNDPHAPANHFDGELDEKNKIDSGTFLISWSGTPGTSFGAFIWERGPAALNQHINKCVFFGDHLNPLFMKLAVNGQMSHFIQSAQGGVGLKHVTKGVLSNALIAVPPFPEQCRIIEKVDELMALCDRLEQQVGDQLEAHEVLVDTLLDTLTHSADANEVAENWARIAEHFDTLFTTEASIDKLKQTILQLAVMGRMVEQDPNDEPASVLLEKIAEEKARLVKERKIKKLKRLPEPYVDEAPFKLPHSWQWCRLPDIGELARGKSKHRPRNDPSLYRGGTIPLIQTGDVARADREISTYTALYNETGVAQSKLWPTGTLCITIAANIGDTGILEFKACFPDSVVGFTPYTTELKNEYFEYFLRTAKRHLEEFAPSTAQKNINLDVLQSILVPLPPVNELHRIIDKVDELMALCDQLKARLGEAGETSTRLAEAVVEQAVS